MEGGLSEYELQRLRNIAENKARHGRNIPSTRATTRDTRMRTLQIRTHTHTRTGAQAVLLELGIEDPIAEEKAAARARRRAALKGAAANKKATGDAHTR